AGHVLHLFRAKLVLPRDHSFLWHTIFYHREDVIDASSMQPVFIRQIGPYPAASITGVTGHTVVVKDRLPFIQRLSGTVVHHGGLVNHSYLGQFSFLSLSLRNERFLLRLFYLGLPPTQHRIVNEIDNPETDGKDEYIL